MNSDYISKLCKRLEARRESILRPNQSGPVQIGKLSRFWTLLHRNPALAGIAAKLASNDNAKILTTSAFASMTKDGLYSADNDETHAAIAYQLLKHLALDGRPPLDRMPLTLAELLNKAVNSPFELWTVFIDPMFSYVIECLEDQQILVGSLVRYKMRSEWFNRDTLYRIADDAASQAGQAQIERELKDDIHRYLHDQGVDFFVEPKSDKGEIDLVLVQTDNQQHYVEGKVFDSISRNKAYIIKGYGQLLAYLRQYNSPIGYLVTFKTCEQQLEIQGCPLLSSIPFLQNGEKTVYFVTIDIHPHSKSVSKRTYDPVCISADELTKAAS